MKKYFVGGLAAGVLLGGAVTADAAIPDANGKINACVARGGAVRIIDTAGEACKTGPPSQAEKALSWPSEAPTVFNTKNYPVENTSVGELTGEFFAFAKCDVGDPMLHGSSVIKQDPSNPNTLVDEGGSTFNSGTQEGWQVDLFFPVGSTVPGTRAFARAVCADLPPLRP